MDEGASYQIETSDRIGITKDVRTSRIRTKKICAEECWAQVDFAKLIGVDIGKDIFRLARAIKTTNRPSE